MTESNDEKDSSENSSKKEEFSILVEEALVQIRKINESYKSFFEAPEGQQSKITEIEARLQGRG